uniref:Uncharacterized protein n=1 Tax=Seriola lalandi dorsalis TaxID=1841481 RepID=A0A3B4XDS9_SERLL
LLMALHVWHKPREWYRPEYLAPTVRGSGGSVMLWGPHVFASSTTCNLVQCKPSYGLSDPYLVEFAHKILFICRRVAKMKNTCHHMNTA